MGQIFSKNLSQNQRFCGETRLFRLTHTIIIKAQVIREYIPMMGIFSTLLFTRKLIVKDKFAVRAFSIDPGGSRTHRHGDF